MSGETKGSGVVFNKKNDVVPPDHLEYGVCGYIDFDGWEKIYIRAMFST